MQSWKQVLGVAGLLLLFGFFSCGQQQGRPLAGDTVTPQLEGPLHWTAGASGTLGVRLYASKADSQRGRLLDFRALPFHLNPVANIAFYAGEQPLQTLEVALSQRC
jgi:hypothetical protein